MGSTKVKSKRKAARGRRKTLSRVTAAEILATQDECKLWDRMLNCEDDRLALEALKYLTDRRDGKSYQAPNPSLEDQAIQADGPRLDDPKITAALKGLLPPPSQQVTVSEARMKKDSVTADPATRERLTV